MLRRSWWPPALAVLGIVLATVAVLRWEGRVWSCACGTVRVWSGNVWSSHCSQHPLDPYSLTHFTHGLIFAGLFALLLRRAPVPWRFVASLALAAVWEMAENSTAVIERYRTATMSLDYLGDSVTNAVADIGCCAFGFVVAMRLGWRWTLALLLAIELGLLLLIRDNLTLNVVMLLWPIEAVRQWQLPG